MGARIHWPTLVFGALPATYLAFPAAIGILFGAFGSLTLKPVAFLMLGTGLLGWVGALALWIAARSARPVTDRTARGLLLGIVGALAYAGLRLLNEEAQHRLVLWPAWLVLGPIAVAIWHLRADGRSRPDPANGSGSTTTAGAERATSPRRLPSTTVERVLKGLLFAQSVVGLALAPQVIGDSSGWGSFYATLATFPFALGLGTVGLWAFWRYPELRRLSAAVLGLLIAWPALYSFAERALGAETAAWVAARAAMLLPAGVVLLLPRQVALFVPRGLLGRRSFTRLIGLQAFLAVFGLGFLLFARPGSLALEAIGLGPTACYLVASLVAGLFGFTLGYVALFTRAGRQHVPLVATSLVTSLVLLGVAGVNASLLWLLFARASLA